MAVIEWKIYAAAKPNNTFKQVLDIANIFIFLD